MKKKYYIAAMFAFGLVAQPAILRANAADEANSIEAVQQQKQRISGLLTDSNGDPIIGATVRVQGTTNRGVISDVEGRYSIEAAPGEVLEFSYIGFVSIEHRVKADETTFNLRMEMDAIATEEVVVVGYGTQKKQTLTGAISTLSGDKVLTTKSTSVAQSLQGKIAGVQIRRCM